MRLGNSKQ